MIPFLAAALLQVVNVIATATLLPESHAPTPAGRSWRAFRDIANAPGIANVLWRRFLYIFAFTSFFTTFSLYLSEVMAVGPEVASGLLAVAGAVGATVQITAVGPLTTRYGLRRTALAGFALGTLAYVALGFERGLVAFAATIVLWAFGGSLLRPILDARVAELAPDDARGTVLGFGDALDNFSLIFAPVTAAAIVGVAPRLAGVLPAVSLIAGGVLTYRDRNA